MKRLGILSNLTQQAPDSLDTADRWREQAKCANPVHDPEMWFPVGEGPTAQQQADAAKRVCYQCPVIDTCIRWALDTHQPAGVWGGLDERERHNLRRREQRAAGATTPADGLQETAQAMLDEHSVSVGDHREWRGPVGMRLAGVVTTAKRIAWVATHGARPATPLLAACGNQKCILPGHMRLQATEAHNTLTAEELVQYRQDVFEARSVDVGDGHREWRASEPVTIGGAAYTTRQLAWVVAHGARPAGTLKVTCGHKGCVTAAHLHDRGALQPQSGTTPERSAA